MTDYSHLGMPIGEAMFTYRTATGSPNPWPFPGRDIGRGWGGAGRCGGAGAGQGGEDGLDGEGVLHSGEDAQPAASPLWGKVAAAELLDGVPDTRLAPYRPARFL